MSVQHYTNRSACALLILVFLAAVVSSSTPCLCKEVEASDGRSSSAMVNSSTACTMDTRSAAENKDAFCLCPATPGSDEDEESPCGSIVTGQNHDVLAKSLYVEQNLQELVFSFHITIDVTVDFRSGKHDDSFASVLERFPDLTGNRAGATYLLNATFLL